MKIEKVSAESLASAYKLTNHNLKVLIKNLLKPEVVRQHIILLSPQNIGKRSSVMNIAIDLEIPFISKSIPFVSDLGCYSVSKLFEDLEKKCNGEKRIVYVKGLSKFEEEDIDSLFANIRMIKGRSQKLSRCLFVLDFSFVSPKDMFPLTKDFTTGFIIQNYMPSVTEWLEWAEININEMLFEFLKENQELLCDDDYLKNNRINIRYAWHQVSEFIGLYDLKKETAVYPFSHFFTPEIYRMFLDSVENFSFAKLASVLKDVENGGYLALNSIDTNEFYWSWRRDNLFSEIEKAAYLYNSTKKTMSEDEKEALICFLSTMYSADYLNYALDRIGEIKELDQFYKVVVNSLALKLRLDTTS